MTTVNEIQLLLQNVLNRTVSQAELGKALGTGRSNISLRIKNKSEIKEDEIKKIESFFGISLLNTKTKHKNIYNKLIQLIDAASEQELEFYYGIIEQLKKGIEMFKIL